MNRLRTKRGMTLVELIISMAIVAAVMVVITVFQKDIFTYNTNLSNIVLGQQEGKQAAKTMEKEIRMSALSETGAYPIAEASTSAITFFSDVNSDGTMDQVRYYLSSTTLKRDVIKPTGSPLTYIAGNASTSILVYNVVNASSTPIFLYYDGTYAGTTTALTQPVNISVIRLVKITLVVDADSKRSPNPTTISEQVSVRSLKDNQ